MQVPSTLTTLVAAFLVLVVSALGAQAAPYPGQPKINNALKHLTEAQKQAPQNPSAAVDSLREASQLLDNASLNKGTFQNMARRLTDQAARHLKAGDTAKALQEISEAIAAVHKGAKISER